MAVQFFDNNDTTPIDDATVQWNTPFYDIATVFIPMQSAWSEKQEEFCRWMSFNPGDSVAAHQPVGILQEIRTAVYQSMATLRHQLQDESNDDATYAQWQEYPNW